MDITKSTEPKSDQQNFDDYMAGPKTVTISEVKEGTPDQPVEVHLVEFPGRPFKPSKSMRRVLVKAWGPKADDYAGRQMTLFGDPTVKFGGQEVGGIRISHLSHIDGTLTVHLTVTRGKRAPFVVEPLETLDALYAALLKAETLAELQAAWGRARAARLASNPRLMEMKETRKGEIASHQEEAGDGPLTTNDPAPSGSDDAAPKEGEPV